MLKYILLCVMLMPCTTIQVVRADQNLHPRLTKDEKWIQAVAVLPPRLDMTDEDGMVVFALAEGLSQVLSEVLGRMYRNKSIRVYDDYFTPASYLRDDKSIQAFTDMQYRFDRLLPKLRNASKDVKKGRFTLGDQVTLLNPRSKPDTFVFIRGSGEINKPKMAMIKFKEESRLSFYIIMVDAYTGDVLSFDKISIRGDLTNQPAKTMEKPIQKYYNKIWKKLGY